MEENPNKIVETTPKLSRKPLQQKSTWKRNRDKNSRYSPKRPPNIKIPCNHYSKAYRCTTLTKEDIIKFNRAFYKSVNKIDQDNLILQCTKVSPVHRRRPKTGTGHKKNLNVVYYARRRNSMIPICRKTFLHILDLKKGRVNGVIMRSFKNDGAVAFEKRGGNHKERKFASATKSIKDFIKKLVPLEIHYCRNKVKSRQYLSSELNINKLYKMYIAQTEEQFKRVKSSYFRRIFNTSFNIGFGTPRTDVCSTCLTLKERMKHEKDTDKKKDLIIEKRVHSLRAKSFYNLLKEKRDDLLILSFDCQKNQPMPKVPDQSAYYSRQLYTYNFTVVIGNSKSQLSTDNVFIHTWTKDFLPKGSDEIANAVFHCLCTNVEKYDKVTTIRLVADGCSGQNKNTTMLGMLSKYLIDHAPARIKNIELVFPVVGHSFLPADCVFAQIEKKIRKTEVIPNPEGFIAYFKDHGTVLKLGTQVEVQKWKEASAGVLKSTTGFHFSIKKCKRFFFKRNKQRNNVLVQAEESYNNRLGSFKNICKKGKNVSQINPEVKDLYVFVKKEKLKDVKNLLTSHYGERWEEMPELKYYKDVLERRTENFNESEDERCEMMDELPSIVV